MAELTCLQGREGYTQSLIAELWGNLDDRIKRLEPGEGAAWSWEPSWEDDEADTEGEPISTNPILLETRGFRRQDNGMDGPGTSDRHLVYQTGTPGLAAVLLRPMFHPQEAAFDPFFFERLFDDLLMEAEKVGRVVRLAVHIDDVQVTESSGGPTAPGLTGVDKSCDSGDDT